MIELGPTVQLGLISYLYLAENYCDIVPSPTGQSRFDQAFGFDIKCLRGNQYVANDGVIHHIR